MLICSCVLRESVLYVVAVVVLVVGAKVAVFVIGEAVYALHVDAVLGSMLLIPLSVVVGMRVDKIVDVVIKRWSILLLSLV